MLVTAVDVVDEANDTARLTPMVEQAEEMTGVRVPMTLADAGYFAGKHLEGASPKGPTGGHAGPSPAYKPPIPQGPVRLR